MKIYDWPDVVPVRQLFFVGGQAVEGGYTSGGVRMLSPEPGGYAFLDVEFGVQQNSDDPLISWLMSRIANGSVFRIPIVQSPQLVAAAALGFAGIDPAIGVPWAGPLLWSNGEAWLAEVSAVGAAAALEGETVMRIDMRGFSGGLRHGHLVGHKDAVYVVDDISYDGSAATVTVMPPLRKDVGIGDAISFRPHGLFFATNPDAFRGLYDAAQLVALGSARFAEAIL